VANVARKGCSVIIVRSVAITVIAGSLSYLMLTSLG